MKAVSALALSAALLLGLASCARKPAGGGESGDELPANLIRVMTFNIMQSSGEPEGHEWASVRKGPCIAMFKDVAPDIVCIQEARKLQCSDLYSALPEYSQIKHPLDNVESNGGQRNLILYKSSKFELLSWDKFWFSEDGTASGPRWGDAATTQRLTVFARLRHKPTGSEFWVYDAHFFDKCNYGTTPPHCVSMCLESIDAQAGPDGTVFLCGGFGLRPGDAVMRPLFNSLGHAATEAPESDGAPAVTYNALGENQGAALDHIFFRGAEPLSYKVADSPSTYGTRWISDHYPVYADFLL